MQFGQLYRSETFLVQGRFDCGKRSMPAVAKGACPSDVTPVADHICPPHDPQCGCHGPIMERGMVGWAGGGAGPDFFIYSHASAASHWGNDHTVVGEVADSESWDVIAAIGELPVRRETMTMLEKPLPLRVGAAP